MRHRIARLIFFFMLPAATFSQPKLLDDFESSGRWKTIASDGVTIGTAIVDGFAGRCIRLDFEFLAGAGYCGIQTKLPITLPENYKFTFYVRAEAPVNNFEFKLLDESGDNVWWVNNRSFEFPTAWQKMTVKKRNISFAWGPTENKNLRGFDKIEFMIASATGGRGSIYIDEFQFQEMEVADSNPPDPRVSASSNAIAAARAIDHKKETLWRSDGSPRQVVDLDLQKHREYGGLIIDWDNHDYARRYNILSSTDGKIWEKIYNVTNGAGGRRYINLKEGESRYLRLDLLESSRGQGFAIHEIEVMDGDFTETPEIFFKHIAANNRMGLFPKYFQDQQSYWNVVGVASDTKEALIDEEGRVEVDARSFSIEPFIFTGGRLVTWADVQLSQKLEQDYLPIPSVFWHADKLLFQIQAFAHGEPGHAVLYLTYKIQNTANAAVDGNLFLALRPFQVNPPWQFLNNPGGTARIRSIHYADKKLTVNGEKVIVPLSPPNGFGAMEFDEGDITELLLENQIPQRTDVVDQHGFASAAMRFSFELQPGQAKSIFLAVPFHSSNDSEVTPPQPAEAGNRISDLSAEAVAFWDDKINQVEFKLPPSADKFINTIRSNLAYILINRDGPGIQPGSRSYERSWIRDGALTSSALLKMGLTNEVKEFFSWYAKFQYENGKVPCVVDRRGADPVPEHDSTGEFIFGLLQYFHFTKDTMFLREHFENVVDGVKYIESLIGQRSTDYYKNGSDSLRALYGLLPESISHEGYSAKPMHSYWDYFWCYRGLDDAVTVAQLLRDDEWAKRFSVVRDQFEKNLLNSITLAMQYKSIDFIPGCVELGDFDATSTTIAVSPCNIHHKLPQPQLQNTFDRYYQYFQKRRLPNFDWTNYTPYELRLVGTFVFLKQPEKSHELLDFFFSHQRPAEWNHWAEVVWQDPKAPKFIGDMPHTWVGSDYINAARAFFLYEDDSNNSLVIGAGLPRDWLDSGEGIQIRNAPTYFGKINYTINKTGGFYKIQFSGDLEIPKGLIRVRNFEGTMPKKVSINGKPAEDLTTAEIVVPAFPSTVVVEY